MCTLYGILPNCTIQIDDVAASLMLIQMLIQDFIVIY